MHFGLQASLQTRLLCEFPDDITKLRTDLLCGCSTQMILQLSALEPLKCHFCLESFSMSILHTDCMTAALYYVYMSACMVLIESHCSG